MAEKEVVLTAEEQNAIQELGRGNPGAQMVCTKLAVFHKTYDPDTNYSAAYFFGCFIPTVSQDLRANAKYYHEQKNPLKLLKESGVSPAQIWELYSGVEESDLERAYFSIVMGFARHDLEKMKRGQ